MTKLQGYVTREVIRAFVPAFLVLLFIMLLGFCVQLLNDGLDVVRLGSLPQHLAAYCLPWVLPPAFLTAVIMAFGRLSAENELVAMRTGGVHMLHVIAPVLALSLVFSVVAWYLHFYTGPTARWNIELLKARAIKLILLDKVALSSQRQLSLNPCTVEYEDYRDGKMLNVVLMDTQGGIARSITVARSGTVTLDPDSPELMYVILHDCKVTQLEGSKMKGPDAEFFRLPIQVAPDPKYWSNDPKYLSFGGMLRRMSELESEVGKHGHRVANPDELGSDLRQKLSPLSIAKTELEAEVDRKMRAIDKCRNLDSKEQGNLIGLAREVVREAEKKKRVLEERQKGLVEEIEKLKDQKDVYDAKVKEMGEISARIASLNKQMSESEAEAEKARKKIEELEAKAARMERDVADLRVQLNSVTEAFEDLRQQHRMASAQESLRELRTKFHQRTALSLAVFAFAMIGIPLGIMTRGRSSMTAFGIGFAIVLFLFYPLLIFGQTAAKTGLMPVVPAVWCGNAVVFTIGLLLTAGVLRK